MSQFTVMLSSSASRTRLLLLDGRDELMRAVLPPGRSLRQRRAATALLEGIALWLDTRLSVVLSADDADTSYFLDLVDEFGCPARSVYFDVSLVEPRARRRPRRIGGVSDFADLRQLSLLVGGVAR